MYCKRHFRVIFWSKPLQIIQEQEEKDVLYFEIKFPTSFIMQMHFNDNKYLLMLVFLQMKVKIYRKFLKSCDLQRHLSLRPHRVGKQKVR